MKTSVLITIIEIIEVIVIIEIMCNILSLIIAILIIVTLPSTTFCHPQRWSWRREVKMPTDIQVWHFTFWIQICPALIIFPLHISRGQ